MKIKLTIFREAASKMDPKKIALDSRFKLELVQVLFRHGARTPIEEELKIFSCVDKSSYEALGLGALNNKGKKQMYDLGVFLRTRYDGFLSANYKSEDVYAYSSNTDRTKMSLQLVLAGLYPPTGQTIWNPNLMWSPVPYLYTPRQFDILLRSYDNRKFRNLIRNSYQSKGNRKKISKNSKFLSERTGIDFINNFYNVAFVYGVLVSNESMDLTLPDWYSLEVKQAFTEAMSQIYDGYVSTPEMTKLGVGPLVKTFVENMNVNQTVINPRKIYLYSGHDGNLAMFTRSHGVREFECPGFGSGLILEKLRDPENRVFLRLLAWTGTGEILILPLGGHSEFCPIEDYLRIVKPVIPSDSEFEKMLSDIEPTKLKNVFFGDSVVKKV